MPPTSSQRPANDRAAPDDAGGAPSPGDGKDASARRRVKPQAPRRSRTTRRVSFNLRRTDEERLRLVAERVDGTENDALRKALATTAYLQQLVDDGGTVVVEDAQGRQRIVDFFAAP